MTDQPILLDVSRLIWRQWTRRLPTGIDRVCLAYLAHFRPRARAVVQFRSFRRILDRAASERLFDLLLMGSRSFRSELVAVLAASIGRSEKPQIGQIYLNVGHTGLNSPYIGRWLREQDLLPVFLIHDLIPITNPEYCRDGEADRHQLRMESALRLSGGLIVNSAQTGRNLKEFAQDRGLAMPPCLVAWLGTAVSPKIESIELGMPKRPYFVMVGTIEARKNHLVILEAWREIVANLGSRAPDLIIIGQRGWEAANAIGILDNPGSLEKRVHEISGCDDDRMAELLNGAQAMLMPSFVEGFGLPVVEALQQGVPVIVSDLPVFREIAGDIPTYLDPHDRGAWVKAVIEYLDAGAAERQRQLKAIRGFRAPTWIHHFDLVDEFLESL
jgi:glycosyltransferase involved in cell wall biosynthesis